MPYEWHILNVTLTTMPLENLVVSRMDADQKEICEILLQTKGNRQYVKNVFGNELAAPMSPATTATGYTRSAGKRITIPALILGCPRAHKFWPGMMARSRWPVKPVVMACVSPLRARLTRHSLRPNTALFTNS